MIQNVIDEARRCLKCKNPRCKKGCPVNTAIPEVIELLLNNEIFTAGDILFENNPLSIVCSMICPHEKQCEGHCILGIKGEPVKFSIIEKYISTNYMEEAKFTKPEPQNRKVAIIGSGPAGITIAFILALKGYSITIFEAHDKIGGVLRYGIPEFRLPKDVLDKMKETLIKLGVKIRPNILVGPILTIEDILEDGYEAAFIGTGVWNPNKLRIKGESLGNVHYAIDYLKNPDVYDLGERVCVIGAGNVAMDVASTAKRKGIKDVIVMYRRGREDMTATKLEIKEAEEDGAEFQFYKSPLEILDDGVKYIETKQIQLGDGTFKLENIEGSEGMLKVDTVIIAASQGPRSNIVSKSTDIQTNIKGLVITDDCGRTTKEGVFASGDVVTGAKTVVEAVRLSKKVALAIEEYVEGKKNIE